MEILQDPINEKPSILFDAKSRSNILRNILRVIDAESNRSLVTASVMLMGSNNFVTRLVLPRRQAPGFISRIYEWSAAHLSRPQQSEAIYKLIGYDDSLRALLSHLGPPPFLSHLLFAEFISFGPRTRPSNWLICLSLFRSLYRKLYARTSSERILKPFENEVHAGACSSCLIQSIIEINLML